MNDHAVELNDRPVVERAFIGFAHAVDNFALARVIAKRQPRGLL
jgi:hypothetical protein